MESSGVGSEIDSSSSSRGRDRTMDEEADRESLQEEEEVEEEEELTLNLNQQFRDDAGQLFYSADYLTSANNRSCTDPNCSFWQKVALISSELLDCHEPIERMPDQATFCGGVKRLSCLPLNRSLYSMSKTPSPSSPSPPPTLSGGGGGPKLAPANQAQLLPKLSFARRNSSCSSVSLSPAASRGCEFSRRFPAGASNLTTAALVNPQQQQRVEKSPSASSLIKSSSSTTPTGERREQLPRSQQTSKVLADKNLTNFTNFTNKLQTEPGSDRRPESNERGFFKLDTSSSESGVYRPVTTANKRQLASREVAGGVAISITDTSCVGPDEELCPRNRRRSSANSSSDTETSSSSGSSGSPPPLANEQSLIAVEEALRQSRSASAIASKAADSSAGHSDSRHAHSKLANCQRSRTTLNESAPVRHHSINERPKHLYITPSFLLQHEQHEQQQQQQQQLQLQLNSPTTSAASSGQRAKIIRGSHSPSRFNFGGG